MFHLIVFLYKINTFKPKKITKRFLYSNIMSSSKLIYACNRKTNLFFCSLIWFLPILPAFLSYTPYWKYTIIFCTAPPLCYFPSCYFLLHYCSQQRWWFVLIAVRTYTFWKSWRSVTISYVAFATISLKNRIIPLRNITKLQILKNVTIFSKEKWWHFLKSGKKYLFNGKIKYFQR